jgi:hypothetical protein
MKQLLQVEVNETVRGISESAGKLTVTIIKPGVSKNGRYYSEALLKGATGIFKGAKMFCNHQTEAEQRARPEGDINDWVANIGSAWAEADGTVRGGATVIDPTFKQKLENLRNAGQLDSMGISIRCAGTATEGEHDGKACKIIESLDGCKSVDFVSFAAAGGRVEAMESIGAVAVVTPKNSFLTKHTIYESARALGHNDLEARHFAHLDFNEDAVGDLGTLSAEFIAGQQLLQGAGYKYEARVGKTETASFTKNGQRVFLTMDGSFRFDGTTMRGVNAFQLSVDLLAIR